MKHYFLNGGYFRENNRGLSPLRAIRAFHALRYTLDETSARFCQPHWTLSCALTDSGAYKVGAKKNPWVKRLAGTVLLVPPNVPYWENFSTLSKPGRSAWICFTGGEISYVNRFTDLKKGIITFIDPSLVLCEWVETAAKYTAQFKNKAFYKVQSLLYACIDRLQKARCINAQKNLWTLAEPGEPEGARKPLSERVNQFLSEHIPRKLSIDKIARECHVSAPSLFMKYRHETGQSPMKELVRLRVETVKRYLAEGRTLKQIASGTGFCDASHLSKTFKRCTGLSPRNYRNALA